MKKAPALSSCLQAVLGEKDTLCPSRVLRLAFCASRSAPRVLRLAFCASRSAPRVLFSFFYFVLFAFRFVLFALPQRFVDQNFANPTQIK
jgi:hypothetical protein